MTEASSPIFNIDEDKDASAGGSVTPHEADDDPCVGSSKMIKDCKRASECAAAKDARRLLRNVNKQARKEARRAERRAVRKGKTPFVPAHVVELAQKPVLTCSELRKLQDKKERHSKVDRNLPDKKDRNSSRTVDKNAENQKAFKARHDESMEDMKMEVHPDAAASQQPVYNAKNREAFKSMLNQMTADLNESFDQMAADMKESMRVREKAQRRLEWDQRRLEREELFGADSEEEWRQAANMQVHVPPATASARQVPPATAAAQQWVYRRKRGPRRSRAPAAPSPVPPLQHVPCPAAPAPSPVPPLQHVPSPVAPGHFWRAPETPHQHPPFTSCMPQRQMPPVPAPAASPPPSWPAPSPSPPCQPCLHVVPLQMCAPAPMPARPPPPPPPLVSTPAQNMVGTPAQNVVSTPVDTWIVNMGPATSPIMRKVKVGQFRWSESIRQWVPMDP